MNIIYRGVYLSDLTFIDEGNPKIVNGLVNFRKKQLEYGVIVQVLRFQNHAYHFKLVCIIKVFIIIIRLINILLFSFQNLHKFSKNFHQ